LHGGANEGVIKMLQEIGTLDKVDASHREALANRAQDHGHRPPHLQGARPSRPANLKRMALILSEKVARKSGSP
jgi:citrate synthase